MLRWQIDTILREADPFIRSHATALPPFAHLSPAALQQSDHAQIKARRLGLDVTDDATGDFAQTGLVLVTLRNDTLPELQAGHGMVYAEKLLVSRVGQLSPMHTHRVKTEDIINRGGGTLAPGRLARHLRAGSRLPDRRGQHCQ